MENIKTFEEFHNLLEAKISVDAAKEELWGIWDKYFDERDNMEQGNTSQGIQLSIDSSNFDDDEFEDFKKFKKEATSFLKKNKVKFQDKGDDIILMESVNEAKSDFMAMTKNKAEFWLKGIKDEDIRQDVGDRIFTDVMKQIEKIAADNNLDVTKVVINVK